MKLWLKIFDPVTGKVDTDRECKSWVIQFIQFVALWGVAQTIKDIGGTGRALTVAPNMYDRWLGPAIVTAGVTSRGIVVGSGTSAESYDNVALTTLIAHGILENQLQYSAGSFTEPGVSGTTVLFKFSRTLTNNSPTNPITVKEVGVYVRDASYSYCIARDLTGNINIANGGGQKVFQFTVTFDNA